MRLVLFTAFWPNGAASEFLDCEIEHLAGAFEKVQVVPLRPQGHLPTQLPDNVTVDHTLARAIDATRAGSAFRRRAARVAKYAVVGRRTKYGLIPRPSRTDMTDRRWLQFALRSRIDISVIRTWAARRPPGDLAYTFWLGSETIGVRQAWPRTPLVSRAHGGDVYSEAHGWSTIPYQGASVAAATRIAIVSDQGQSYLAEKYPLHASNMEVRRLGTEDLGGLAKHSSSETVRVLSASTVDGNKRVTAIAKALAYLASQRSAVHWTHLGDGPDMPRVHQCLSAGSEALTAELPGHVPLKAVHEHMLHGNYDVFVNFSLSEGAPVTLMEAQCAGLPVTATAVGGVPEVAAAQFNELLSPDSSAEQLANAILRAATRPASERPQRRAWWADRYDAHKNYASFATELVDLAELGWT